MTTKQLRDWQLRVEKLLLQFQVEVDLKNLPQSELGLEAERFMGEHKKEFIYLNITLDYFISRL